MPYYSGLTHMPERGIDSTVVMNRIGSLPYSSLPGLPWWVPPAQGGDWEALKQYIKGEYAKTNILSSSNLTGTDTETRPIAHIKALTKFTQQAFTDRSKVVLLNNEMSLMRKTVFQ